MREYYIASVSNGKDSMAMALRLIEDHKPLNELVFFDNGMEFQAIYDNWNKLSAYAKTHGIKSTVLKLSLPFLYTMLDKPVNAGKPNEHKGYQWCGGLCQWGGVLIYTIFSTGYHAGAARTRIYGNYTTSGSI